MISTLPLQVSEMIPYYGNFWRLLPIARLLLFVFTFVTRVLPSLLRPWGLDFSHINFININIISQKN